MAEHLDADALAPRAADILLVDLTVDLGHLLQAQLARQHHHVGKLGVELQRLNVGDVELGRQMHLQPDAVAIGHHRHVAGDDSADVGLLGGIANLAHGSQVLTIDDGIHREIRLDAVLLARQRNDLQVVDGEVIGRVRPHVQLSDAEIHRAGTGLNGCCQRVARPHGGHDLKIADILFHAAKLQINLQLSVASYQLIRIFAPMMCRIAPMMSRIAYLLVVLAVLVACQEQPRQEAIAFNNDVLLPITPVKDQRNSDLCWAYAMLATIETEHIVQGDSVNLSADFVARHLLRELTLDSYLRRHNRPISLRGMAPRLINRIMKDGLLSYDSYHSNECNYRVLQRKLTNMAHVAANRRISRHSTTRFVPCPAISSCMAQNIPPANLPIACACPTSMWP